VSIVFQANKKSRVSRNISHFPALRKYDPQHGKKDKGIISDETSRAMLSVEIIYEGEDYKNE